MKYAYPYTAGDPLPLQPGDIVYEISDTQFYKIVPVRIHGVAVYKHHCAAVIEDLVRDIVSDCSVDDIPYVFFPTKKAADSWKRSHLNKRPFPITDCTEWVSPDNYVPEQDNAHVYVKLDTPDGIVKVDAFYDDGSKYPEDKGFWDGDSRHANKLINVIAWIGNKAWDEEE